MNFGGQKVVNPINLGVAIRFDHQIIFLKSR